MNKQINNFFLKKVNSKVFGAIGRKKLPLTDMEKTVDRADLREGRSGVK